MDVDACIENLRLIDFIFENSHKKWKLMYVLGMCHGGNQYINLITDACNGRKNFKYHHVSYIISYRLYFLNHPNYTNESAGYTGFIGICKGQTSSKYDSRSLTFSLSCTRCHTNVFSKKLLT